MAKLPSITIAGRRIALDEHPYVIAELSANHNGRFETARQMLEEAKAAGADAVKLQTYRPDTITPWEWHAPLFEHARKLGITIFSSPFDKTAVDLLEDLNAPAYKIASFEAVDLSLIKYVASTGKPMIISTGMADAEEIQEAIDAAREGGCKELAILHCVSGYPAPAEDYNLRTIPDMMERFGLVTGLSDHTLDNTTAIASVALGASIIEKHFTLNRSGGGPDDSFSLEPAELAQLCQGARTAWSALGRIDYGRKSSEQGNAKFRRSLYVVEDLLAGDILTEHNLKSIRPGFGLAPKHFEKLLGARVVHPVERGTAASWEMIGEVK
jgi:pseudaminic acid synthase